MKKKTCLENIKINVETHTNFYKFRYLNFMNSDIIINFDGENSYLCTGTPVMAFISKNSDVPLRIDDVAYEECGKLYHLITNEEVRRIELGDNLIEKGVIYAAYDSIKPANKKYVDIYSSIVSINNNLYMYYRREINNKDNVVRTRFNK